MKHKMQHHLRSCGQVQGFLSRYAALSIGVPEKQAESEFTAYCVECDDFLVNCNLRGEDRNQHLYCAMKCLRYIFFMNGWKEGQQLGQQAFETADLSLIEAMGSLAGSTTKRPPRMYRSITAERDAADGGFQGEVWHHFVASWRQTGGDRRRTKGV